MTDIPSYDDLADTLSANLRVGRATAIRLDALTNALSVLSLCILLAMLLFAVVTFRKITR